MLSIRLAELPNPDPDLDQFEPLQGTFYGTKLNGSGAMNTFVVDEFLTLKKFFLLRLVVW